jgi:hypothetical protein
MVELMAGGAGNAAIPRQAWVMKQRLAESSFVRVGDLEWP